MPSFIASLANSYQDRQIYLAEAATPASNKWNHTNIGLIHRVFAAACVVLMELGTLFSSQWQQASYELRERVTSGTLCQRAKKFTDPKFYQALNIPINKLPGIDQDFHKLGLLLPSEMGQSAAATATAPLFQSSIDLQPHGPLAPVAPPTTLPFAAQPKTPPQKAANTASLPARFTVIKDPTESEPELLIPVDKPHLLDFYIQKGWEIVPIKMPPKIDAFTLNVLEWRTKVLAAQTGYYPASAYDNTSHNEILPGLFLGGNYAPTTTYSIEKEILSSNPQYDVIISVNNNLISSLKAGFHYMFPFIGDVNASSMTSDSVSKALSHIDAGLRQGKRVLVHCSLGQSRSPSIVAMYIAIRTGVSLDQAIKYMKSKRSSANPNPTYTTQHNTIRPKVEEILFQADHPFKMINFSELEA